MTTPLNSLGYAVLSDTLRRKVFGDIDLPPDDPYKINTIMDQMQGFGVKFPIKNPPSFSQLPEDFNIPPLNGLTISDHFRNISKELMGDYEERLRGFMKLSIPSPPPPSVVQECVGWVKYTWLSGGQWELKRVKGIEESVAIFDCETFVKGSDFGHPILATVVTAKAYYIWMHEAFVYPTIVEYKPKLVPLGRGDMILIAHNVAFDRQRTEEAYSLNDTNKWFDTMSAHINVSGLGSEQRFWFTDPKNRVVGRAPTWTDRGCLNNLVDCYNFHCKPEVLLEKESKETRNIFVVAESLSEMASESEELVQYALRDVKYTYELYSVLAWKYLESNPSLTTLCGHFGISSAILPVVDNWSEWVEGCEEKWEEAIHKQNDLLNEIAKEVYEDWKGGELEVESDPWLSQLDWSFSSSVTSTGKPRSKWYGIPIWVKKVSEVDPQTREVTFTGISTKNLLSHILLRLKWGESPLVYVKERGWTYFDKDKGEMTQVPHPKNEGSNVGGVLSKDFLPEFETGVLNSDLPQANELIKLAINVAYWTSVRSRVKSQLVQRVSTPEDKEFNLIVPSAVPHNTSTNRAGENLWLTVPDPKYDKIGSEIKTRVQAPPGYVFVQSDFDAQEAVIASIFADSYHKIAGSTQLSHSILAGTKEDGSDMHSMTAKAIDISRDVAKGCNYAMLYGCGAKTLANTIRRGNKSISMEEATKLGRRLISVKKGKKSDTDPYLMVNGSDSYAYNVMAKIANESVPTNPLSGTRMSTAFRPFAVGTDFWTMRNNWCIQSTGSAMLHGFMTCMEYLFKTYKLNARFCMAVHDSVLYMCPEAEALEVAKMFQVAHVWCWSWLRYNFDIYEMPTANAWLSSIEIDRIFRKSAHSPTITVSQSIKEPDGKSYTMVDLVKLF